MRLRFGNSKNNNIKVYNFSELWKNLYFCLAYICKSDLKTKIGIWLGKKRNYM